MKKFVLAASLSAAMMGNALLATMSAQAQAPGGGGFGGGASQRNSPKRRLTGLIRNIGDLEKNNKKPLAKDQAKKVLAAVNPWKVKPKMTDDEAKKLYGTINTVLTSPQKNELDKMAAQNNHFGSGDRGGQGGGGGAGGPGGGGNPPSPEEMKKFQQTRQLMQTFMKTMNPFYPPQNYKELKSLPERMQESMAKRYKARTEILAKLAAKAK